MKLSQILSNLMDNANISAYKMSKDTGISDRLIGYWKNGDKMPSAENLLIIANYFSISVDYLLTGTEKSPSSELTEEEQKCLEAFNELYGDDQALAIGFMKGLAAKYDHEAEAKENVS